MSTDLELWCRAAEGDGEALGALFDRYARDVYNHCFRRTADWSAAEDLTSVVFLEAWRRRGEVRISRESALPWLLGVANNVLRNRRRSLRRHKAALEQLPAQAYEPDPAEDVAGRIDDERRMRKILTVMDRLPPADREVLTLCVWSELTYEEAAVALGVPVGTVRSRLSRARSRLKEHLEKEPGARLGHRWSERLPALRKKGEEL
ncbi:MULTISPECIES: RNA polymerase sigma factor [unclassified Nonomuraea]|uniref:RNA polymerase sigma factor n=1 Tax=unclassified Nonomuraea TaxID=2593643 RepID=UPI0033C10AEA